MLSRTRSVLPALALIGAVALSGCTSASTPAGGTSSTPSGSSPAATGRAVTPAAVAALANRLQRGLAAATSAHLSVSTKLSGQALRGSGEVVLVKGAISQADLQQALPSSLGTITVVMTGGTTYAKLPTALRSGSTRPWVVLTPGSKSVLVSELASTVQPILAVASPASLVTFTRAASSISDLGSSATGGTTTTHYRLVVDAAKLPASVPKSITAGGKSSIPIDMYLDATGLPRQVVGTFSISGQTVTPTITLSGYDAPVSITAPPAGQVSR